MIKRSFVVALSILGLLPFIASAQSLPTDVNPNGTVGACITLQNGMGYRSRDTTTNGEVSTLQDFLNSKGYLASEPTGYFGLLTVAAVKQFQGANGISQTGYVGNFTKAKIHDVSCGTAGAASSNTGSNTSSTGSVTYPNTSDLVNSILNTASGITTGTTGSGGTQTGGTNTTVCPQYMLTCPDGSHVGPTGPNCSVPACPTSGTGGTGTVAQVAPGTHIPTCQDADINKDGQVNPSDASIMAVGMGTNDPRTDLDKSGMTGLEDAKYYTILFTICSGGQSVTGVRIYDIGPRAFGLGTVYLGKTALISGINFTPTGNTVLVNGTVVAQNLPSTVLGWVAAPNLVPGGVIAFTVPTSLSAGSYYVKVKNANGQSAEYPMIVQDPAQFPHITSISPQSGPVGTRVTITATNLDALQNTVEVAGPTGSTIVNPYSFENLPSNNGTVTFTIPATTDFGCLHKTPPTCNPATSPMVPLKPGVYTIFVAGLKGESDNSTTFTITGTGGTGAPSTRPTPPTVSYTCGTGGTSATFTYSSPGATVYYPRLDYNPQTVAGETPLQQWDAITATTKTITGLVPGTNYQFWVHAGNGGTSWTTDIGDPTNVKFKCGTAGTGTGPTASLTVNGSHDVTIVPGDQVNYVWSSSGGTSWSSSWSATGTCADNGQSGTWSINSANGTLSRAASALAGCTYTFRYTVANSVGSQSDTIQIHAVSSAVGGGGGGGGTTGPITVSANISGAADFAGTYATVADLVAAIQASGFTHCVVYNNAQIYSGFGPCVTIPVTTTPPGGGTGPIGGTGTCTGYTIVDQGDLTFNGLRRPTTGMTGAAIAVWRIPIPNPLPAGWVGMASSISFYEYIDGQYSKKAYFSKNPCDFGATWPAASEGSSGHVDVSFQNPGYNATTVQAGDIWYLTVKNERLNGAPSCATGASCNFAVTPSAPSASSI